MTEKTALITGASSGIGEAIAYELAKDHYRLILVARRTEALKQVAIKCEALGAKMVRAVPLDVTDVEAVDDLFEEIVPQFKSLDLLICSAGFGFNQSFLSFDMNLAAEMIRVNLLALMYMNQKAANHMLGQRSGHIMNIGSLAGKVSSPKSAVYAATKAAVISFSNSLRIELKPFNIHVSSVNLGPVRTDFFNEFDPNHEYLQKMQGLTLEVDDVAKKIKKFIEHPKKELNLPWTLYIGSRLAQIFPDLADYIIEKFIHLK